MIIWLVYCLLANSKKMSKPFNFYQQISGLEFHDSAPTPFALFFVNTSGVYGVYFPIQVSQGAPLHLFNDGDISPTRFRTKISGKVKQDPKDLFPFIVSSSGNFYPAPPDNPNYFIQSSGNVSGVSPDIVNFNIPISGNIPNVSLDIISFNNTIKGNIPLCPLDLGIFTFQTYGDVMAAESEFINFRCNTIGKFRAKPQDKMNVNFFVNDISFAPGINQINYNDNDLANLTFNINTITFTKVD